MNNYMINILQNYLVFEDNSLKDLMLEVVNLCKTSNGLRKAITRLSILENEYAKFAFLYKAPYCSLLLSYAYFRNDDKTKSISKASTAVEGFVQRSQAQNLIVSLWIRAVEYEKGNHIENAWHDLQEALELVERELVDCKRRSEWAKKEIYEEIHQQLNNFANRLRSKFPNHIPMKKSRDARSSAHPPSPPAGATKNGEGGPGNGGTDNNSEKSPDSTSSPTTIKVNVPIDITMSNQMRSSVSSEIENPIDVTAISSNLLLPIIGSKLQDEDVPPGGDVVNVDEMSLPWLPMYPQPQAQANPEGTGYVLQTTKKAPVTISCVIIDGQVYDIRLLRKTRSGKDRLINLVASRRYGWVKVSGDSMKDFDPKIEDGDYVLFYEPQVYPVEEDDAALHYNPHNSIDDNVVIVRQEEKLTREVQILIKFYNRRENSLYSYNKEKNYRVIPLCKECQIIGIVVAVTKPHGEEDNI